MSTDKGETVLYFDFHFKLINKPDEVISFLNQFENIEINPSDFNEKIQFQSLIDVIGKSNQMTGGKNAFEKEVNAMFDEIRLEIRRRLRTMLAFGKHNQLLKSDRLKIKVFTSLLIDLKQQGMFDMIKDFVEENKLFLGNRFSLEDKYKPFTPKLGDTGDRNHYKTEFTPKTNQQLPKYIVWLNNLEYEKVFAKSGLRKHRPKIKSFDQLPEDLIFEKIVPKVIAANTFAFNAGSISTGLYEEIFNLNNYYLNIATTD